MYALEYHRHIDAYGAMRYLRDLKTRDGALVATTIEASDDGATIPPEVVTDESAQLLHQAVSAVADTHSPPATPAYVVWYGGVPVAWLTRLGRVVAPHTELTRSQRRSQRQAVTALRDLRPSALVALADERARREGRTPVGAIEPRSARIAAVGDVTFACWTEISPDQDTNAAVLHRLVGSNDVRILETRGYGEFDREPPPQLDILRQIECIATAHALPADTVGTCAARLLRDPSCDHAACGGDSLMAMFDATYQGVFTEYEFADHLLEKRGWQQALNDAGIPDRYFRRHAFESDMRLEYAFVECSAHWPKRAVFEKSKSPGESIVL